jgi:hypothetical protein
MGKPGFGENPAQNTAHPAQNSQEIDTTADPRLARCWADLPGTVRDRVSALLQSAMLGERDESK